MNGSWPRLKLIACRGDTSASWMSFVGHRWIVERSSSRDVIHVAPRGRGEACPRSCESEGTRGIMETEAERATPVVHGLRIRMVDRGNETSDFRTASSGLLGTSAEGREDGYLVDPASSHMLVSKIKPCMSKYKRLCTVKLRMAH